MIRKYIGFRHHQMGIHIIFSIWLEYVPTLNVNDVIRIYIVWTLFFGVYDYAGVNA